MTYPINTTDGSALITPTMPLGVLQDGTLDTSTGVTLIGRNYPSYGEIQNENFIKLLQNFANAQPPSVSQDALILLPGTLWFDTANNILNVYNGTEFIPASQRIVSSTTPTATNIGDQWWDSTNQQLRSWTGTAWQLIGPAYTAGQGKSGTFVELVTDTLGTTHVVVSEYVKNIPVTVTSIDPVFTVNTSVSTSYTGFTSIQPGINAAGNVIVHGTATNSNTVGGLSSTVFARNDIPTTFGSDVTVVGNLTFSNANLSTSSGSLIAQNKNLGGNVEVFLNTTNHGNVRGLSIDGVTGQAYVYSDPTNPLGIATKNYTDALGDALNTSLNTAIGEINANVNAIYVDYVGNISVVIASTNANLAAVQSGINANVTATNAAIVSANVAMNSHVGEQIDSLNTLLTGNINTLATQTTLQISNLNSTLTGQINAVQNYIDTTINPEITSLNNSVVQLAADLIPLANIASPTFTGTPAAPTPGASDNSTKIATTAFVQSAINAQKFNYTVRSTPPEGGNDGDFWFQIG